MTNKQLFLKEYEKQLRIAHEKYNDLYAWRITEFDEVFKRMSEALIKGSYNKDSHAIKAVCKTFKIKHTYSEINNFIKQEESQND